MASYLGGNVPLIKSQTYSLYPNSGNDQNIIAFSIDSAGKVTSYSSGATGGAGTLTFNTGPLTVNVNNWAASWQMEGFPRMIRNQTLTLVRGFGYTLYANPGVAYWRVPFSVDAAGNVSASGQATGSGSTLTLDTVTTSVETAAANRWMIPNAEDVWRSGNDSVTLIKGFSYTLLQFSWADAAGYSQAFSITSGGNSTPASLNPSGSSAYTLRP